MKSLKKKIKFFNDWNVNPRRKYNNIEVEPLTCEADGSHGNLIAFNDNGVIKLGCNICEYTEDFVSSELFDSIK